MKKRYRNITTPLITACAIAGMLALAVFANVANAGVIPTNTYLQFSFLDVGSAATGCDPADPAGALCFPSSGTPTTFLDAPPWTFTAPASGVNLGVTDAFGAGDRFEVFDFGVSLGLTSAFNPSGDCGDDPVACFADANMSSGIFALAAGDHSITIVLRDTVVGPDGPTGGSGYLIAAADNGGGVVPEPTSLMLLAAAGIAGFTTASPMRRRLQRARTSGTKG